MRLSKVLWIILLIFCIGVGFLHGYLPQGITRNIFSHPTKIRVLTTDEILFPKALRDLLEQELYVTFDVTVTRDWDLLIAKTVASPSQDLIFLPSYWAEDLRQQNLTSEIIGQDPELTQRVSLDFIESLSQNKKESKKLLDFMPIYWIKTGFLTPHQQNFENELLNKSSDTLYLLADEDLILKHFLIWKKQGLLPLISQKKILTLQLDQLNSKNKEGIIEASINEDYPHLETDPELSALLIWGALIPTTSQHRELALDILNILTSPYLQESILMQTPLNTTLITVTDSKIPSKRKAGYLRQHQLLNTILIDHKEIDAQKKLKSEFGITL